MIKRILFDQDNTLIKWKDEYRTLSMNEAGIYDLNLIKKVDEAIPIYEESVDYIKVDELINHLSKLGLTYEQAYNNINNDKNRYEKASKELIELLEYLSSKYELVVVTNWFLDIQRKRLENSGILKYFKKIYSSDYYKSKPNKEIFVAAMGDYKPSECIMLGDSITKDVKPAIELGMDAYLVGEDKNYKCLKSVLKLKEML